MKRVLFIVNPHSGKQKIRSDFFDIIDTMSEHSCLVTTRILRGQGDARLFAKEACDSGEYDIIVCSGGDGTLNGTVAGVIQSASPVTIGYIPAGSTNDYARSMGIPSDPIEAAKAAVTGHSHCIDVGLINGINFNYVASFGAFTAVSYSAPQSLKNLLGHMAYVLAGIKDLTKIKSCHAIFECDGARYEDDYIFGAITNSTSIGGVVRIDVELVGFNDGLFEVCLVKKPKNPADLLKIMLGAANSDFTADCFDFFKINHLKITMPDGIPWSLDGEKYDGSKDIEIKVLKSAIKLNLPETGTSIENAVK